MTLNLITLLYISNFNQVDALLYKHAAKGIDVAELSAAIKHESAVAKQDPVLITRLVLLESRGVAHAHNKKSNDKGLMQVNKIHKISNECAFNVRCNLRAGIKILKDMKRSSRFRPCSYNLGNKVDKYKKTCNDYERKLNSFK